MGNIRAREIVRHVTVVLRLDSGIRRYTDVYEGN